MLKVFEENIENSFVSCNPCSGSISSLEISSGKTENIRICYQLLSDTVRKTF